MSTRRKDMRLHGQGRLVVSSALLATLISLAGCGSGETGPASQAVEAPPSVTGESEGLQAAPVRLTEDQARTLSIRTVTIAREPIRFVVSLPGVAQPAPDYFAEVSSPLSGRIASMSGNEGDPVSADEVVAELESLELANLAADYLEARADLEYTRSQVNRYEQLVERQITPEAVLERARADLTRARARSTASHARLHSLGVSEADLERWYVEELDQPLLPIRAPIDGVISEHLIELGQSVTAYQKMMTVVNTERVLVQGFLSPDDAAFVRPGDPVTVSFRGAASRSLDTRVTTVSPALAEGSRSVTVNVNMATQDGWPIPGESVRLGIEVTPEEAMMAVPLSAVEFEGESALVFVQGADPLTWVPQAVEVARITTDEIIVASGLKPGDVVATSQVFSLKAMRRFEQYGEGD